MYREFTHPPVIPTEGGRSGELVLSEAEGNPEDIYSNMLHQGVLTKLFEHDQEPYSSSKNCYSLWPLAPDLIGTIEVVH
ncbi:MAG: hypothetical protein DMG65_05025 [Candidatus Angelobacter sp. Gp1-AA117]|nr:MAG: hypothetical protein DMG65_05025 [Candidatus Angelobacter sp. Gp1-AA117]